MRHAPPPGLIDAADVSRLAVQLRAVSHGLAEFENHGVITDGDDSWRRVLAALIDGYSAAGQDPRE